MVSFDQPSCPTITSGRFGALPGQVQSVPRAELYAAVQAIEGCSSADITLVSDNKYFVDGTDKEWRKVQCAPHADLWQRWFEAVELKSSVTVHKVKSHGTAEEIKSGLIPWDYYVGNAYADVLANEGAARAAVPDALAAEVHALDSMAWQIQSRLVAILCAGTTRAADKALAQQHREKRLKERKERQDSERAEEERLSELPQEPTIEEALGPPEVPERFGGERSTGIHISHRIRAGDGFIWCERCGCFATSRGRNLLRECLGFKTTTGIANIKRISRGLAPHNAFS